jgi:hypothetical protein
MATIRTIVAALCLGLPIAVSSAQDAAPAAPAAEAPATKGYTGAVTADNVFIRSGPSVQGSYPFGRLMLGNLVQVDEESFGWAKVRTSGPAFGGIHGYVLANESVTLSPDGSTLTVVKATEIRAPNLDADGNPDSSFKVIGSVPANATLKVLGQVNGDREKVHKVVMPDSAVGWININYIRRASPSEVAAGSGTASPAGAAPATTGGSTAPAEKATPAAEEKKAAEKPAPKESAPPPPPVKTEAQLASEKRRADFKDLEAIWEKVKAEPQESAEIAALKSRYQALAADPAAESDIKAMAGTRVKQLQIQGEIQKGIQDARRAQSATNKDDEKLTALRIAMEGRADYTAVGVLNASTVYDGKRLPLLFRLTDPASGQTVAYVAVKDANTMSTMLGTLVGIRGSQRFDEALKVNIIDPGTIDLLTIRKEAQVSPANK